MQLHHLVSERRDHVTGLEWEDVEAQLQRLFKVDQRLEPARTDGARVSGHGERTSVLVVEAHVVAGNFERGRRNEIGQRPGAEGEAPLIRGPALPTVDIGAEL